MSAQTSGLAAVFAALDTLVLERDEGGAFRVLGEVPDWYRGFDAEGAAGGLVYPARGLLFLEGFLADAQALWAAGAPAELASGPWTEADTAGRPAVLEATAVNASGRKLLLLRRLGTGHRESERILQTARNHALEHARLLKEIEKKEILLHCIVHDLANPLAAIRGALGLLRAGPGQDADRLLELAQRACERQETMIHEILKAFAGEAQAFDPGLLPTARAPDLWEMATALVQALEPAFTRAGVHLTLGATGAPAGDWRVVAEAPKLERVMANLLENALRYAPASSTVALGLAAEGGGILLSVDDRGPGLAPEQVPRLFQKFAGGGEHSGKSGLGLYFCRITVERWGGATGYCPRPGGGARFWVWLAAPTEGGVSPGQ